MVYDHRENRVNGVALANLAGTVALLRGRTTGLPIYEVEYSKFRGSPLSGANLDTVVRGMNPDNAKDMANRQPTNHNDDLGNLPVAPGGKVEYREYYLAGNGFNMSGYVRLVSDRKNKRLYITPTHYDVWQFDMVAAGAAPVAAPIAPTAPGARNPFFHLRGAGAVNPMYV